MSTASGTKERRSTMYQKINHPVIRRNSVEHRLVTLPAKMWIDLGEQTNSGCTWPVWTLKCVYHKNRDPCFMPIVRHPWIEAWVWKAKRWLDHQNCSRRYRDKSRTSFITDIHTTCMYLLCQLSTASKLMFCLKRFELQHWDWQGLTVWI